MTPTRPSQPPAPPLSPNRYPNGVGRVHSTAQYPAPKQLQIASSLWKKLLAVVFKSTLNNETASRPSVPEHYPRSPLTHRVVTVTTVTLLLLLTPSLTHAATKYWVGGSGDNVGTNANDWSNSDPGSCNDGGGDASTVPGSSDIAVFDADCDNNATIAATLSVAGIQINSGYTGTVTQNDTIAVTVGSSNYSQADGTFTGAATSGNIDVNGTYSLSGGTFTSTRDTLFVSSTFTISGSPTFTHNSGTVELDGASASVTITPSTAVFNNVTVNKPGGAAIIANSNTLMMSGTLVMTRGNINQTTIPSTGSIAVQGHIIQGSASDGGTGRVEITGSGDQTFTGNATSSTGNLPIIEIDKSGGTLTLIGTLRTSGHWTYTAGTVDATTNDSTMIFWSNGGTTLTGSQTLDNVTIDKANNALTIANSNTLTVAGTLTLTDGSLNQTTIPSTGSIAAQGHITQASTFDGGTARIEITGSADQVFTGGEARLRVACPASKLISPAEHSHSRPLFAPPVTGPTPLARLMPLPTTARSFSAQPVPSLARTH